MTLKDRQAGKYGEQISEYARLLTEPHPACRVEGGINGRSKSMHDGSMMQIK